MDSQVSDYWKRRLKIPTWTDKLKYKITIWKLTEHQVHQMQEKLIEAKDLYFETQSNDSAVTAIAKKYYEERIRTLPKKYLYDLYQIYSEFKSEPNVQVADLVLGDFVLRMTLTYPLDGWLAKRVLQSIANHHKQ